jgi:hypothetical protein
MYPRENRVKQGETFEDGRSAIYSTALLYDLLPNEQWAMTECNRESEE